MKLPRKYRVNVHQTMKDACVKTELKMCDSNTSLILLPFYLPKKRKTNERDIHSEKLLNIYLSLYLFEKMNNLRTDFRLPGSAIELQTSRYII